MLGFLELMYYVEQGHSNLGWHWFESVLVLLLNELCYLSVSSDARQRVRFYNLVPYYRDYKNTVSNKTSPDVLFHWSCGVDINTS